MICAIWARRRRPRASSGRFACGAIRSPTSRATHSASRRWRRSTSSYPGALIYKLDEHGLSRTTLEETEHYNVTRDFLLNPQRFLKHLFDEE